MKKENSKVSIIIPCREIDDYAKKCVRECLKLDYPNFEILVLPDCFYKKFNGGEKVRIIETGNVKPAVKRNIGMEKAKGNFFAFIDSDAYPKRDWLSNAMEFFDDEKIGIVGGPNLTPSEGNFAEKVSGYVYSNYLVSGTASVRYKIAKNQYVKELPSCNYISRLEISPKYDPTFLTAEDSRFCFDISRRGFKILYSPEVIVYHHRRNSLKGHLKQVFIYSRDIAWLTKKEFSWDKMFFSLLSLFSMGFIVLAILSFYFGLVRKVFVVGVLVYFVLIGITSLHKNIKTSFFVFLISIATHFTYGFGWLYGIFRKQK